MKRLFDVIASAIGLLLLSPVLLLTALLVKLTSPGTVLFLQQRVGRGGKLFSILKFRTMVQEAPKLGGPITFGADARITPLGKFLRKTKIDELPQLLNVLKGDMSVVGPRPEVPRYVEMFSKDYVEILRVRPGMTDLASIEYVDEAATLGQSPDPEKEYVERVLPEKIRLAHDYVRRQSLLLDLGIIADTLLRLVYRRHCGGHGTATRSAGNEETALRP
jgi:lipopolysaccharide/colanic/teichoic acid biosynthesis glycosyltransferase